MKRSRFARRGALNREAELVARLATGLAASASRIEDDFWERRLAEAVDKLLRTGNEDTLNVALDHLYGANGRAYDALADLIESRAEGGVLGAGSGEFDVAMFAAPLLAWSRFTIPSGPLPAGTLAAARSQLQAHVLAAGARLALADFLYSPDQLPRGFVETWRLANQLAKAAADDKDARIDPRQLPETTRFISDTRYLIGAVMAPRGQALFRWQEEDGSRDQSASQWIAQGGSALQPLFTGCALEPLLPDVFHAACRNADQGLRVYSLRAAMAFLQTVLNAKPQQLRAVVAPFHEERLEEYRVGFTLADSSEIVHGVVWPLLGAEDESTDCAGQIEAVLEEAGVGSVMVLEQRFPLEFCDDCGMPMYPTPEGETSHAELPEDLPQAPAHLH
ncbi:MAG: DUF2863 family protein [Burkholderiales bacterium]|jgi:hypothetical protein|uniref:DUF2863 domain-containing protein n=1 Tax=Candidatus Desulfobacillus denitrificans TaxID=2608985 RepID=A0A809SAU8_9PROT|nr:DUF2863 family protein [Zoogloeaceae bacterium]MBP9655361.1 DUF2863 family protein [Rhodocyclaceae bacterium]MCZ2173783.1 DUF2863 family protein [Burkholderiales bacterium]OQY66459.1 MAG: hypothetical protein B6D47_11620 [Rhodocyclaceae bacterium UTPRO2]BBO21144.1 conserved hypothetical protein [Candidatus Desulfobacillus denitrificans]GIK45794.1 MAG: hypothetical protein BroJett012_16970 [Betaproteobacteria bacterium]